MKNLLCAFILVICCFSWSDHSFAAPCTDVFPDAVSNSRGSGQVQFGFGSRIINSPDNIIDTENLNDNAGGGTSCNGVSCTASNMTAENGNFNTFPNNQPDITLGFQGTQTISAGNYDDLNLGSEAVLTMNPGVYAFRGNVNLGFRAQIIIASPGAVTIYVRGTVGLNTEAEINTSGVDRYVFLFSRNDVSLGFRAIVEGVIFSRSDVSLNNESSIVGAVTARGIINLPSASTVTFDDETLIQADFGTFCESDAITANLIAEWRLDEQTWNGSAGEVADNSGNNLNGRSVILTTLANTQGTIPALTGSPGTCRYGSFNGTADGYVQIDDPGTGSILDLNSTFTVATWINTNSFPSGSNLATIVSKDENFEFHLNSAGRVFWWWGGGDREFSSTQSVSLNMWHHVAITFESGEQHIYIDGVSVGTNNSTSAITVNNDAVFIGTDIAFHSRRFDGLIDEVRIYDGALTEAQINSLMSDRHDCVLSAGLDAFVIDVGGGAASVCNAFDITISAVDVLGNPISDYTGTIDLSVSRGHGDWFAPIATAQGVLFPGASNSGDADYAFNASNLDAGEVTLTLSNQFAESVTVTVTDSSEGVSTTSSVISFSENAFLITNNDTLGDDVIAGRQHDFTVDMMRRDPITGDCGIATNYTSPALKVWMIRTAADPGGTEPDFVGSSTFSLPSSQPATTNVTAGFMSAGTANFSLDVSDVGQFALYFLDDSGSSSDQDITGSSPNFTARPFGFLITAQANPGASSATGVVYTTAGTDFTVDVQAKAWNTADDSNDDGVPDFYVDTSYTNNTNFSGADLLSFGLESPAESLELSVNLQLPGGGNNPGLASSLTLPADARILSSFTNGGAQTTSVNYPEVGIIGLQASVADLNYLGSGTGNTGRSFSYSNYVGRFTPVSFRMSAIQPVSITPSCSSFLDYIYMGKDFSVSLNVDAVNAQGVITQNYEGNFQKLNESAGSFSLYAIDDDVPTLLSTRINHRLSPSYNWVSGVGALQGDNVVFSRMSVPDGAYEQVHVGAQIEDSDGVRFATAEYDLDSDNDTVNESVELGEFAARFGRLRLASAFGPETANLPVDFVTEYWNVTAWVRNTDDSCTGIALSAITYPSGTIDVTANRIVAVGGGTSQGQYANIDSMNVEVDFSSGNAGHFFTAPNAGNTGIFNVDVDLSNYSWLRFDWDQDGDYSNDTSLPSAEYSFGSYRAHDRIIFWQEILRN